MKVLTEAPNIHETAVVVDCDLGKWTEIHAHVSMRESSFGDYSYIVKGGNVVWSTIGKFCSIAEGVRINPGNHATWRASQHISHTVPLSSDWERMTTTSSNGGAITGSPSGMTSGSATA
jgi:acetyltransferase-like isoleucine patch superfamily enzyme